MPPVTVENDLTLVELHRMLYTILNSTDNNERRSVEASVVQSLSRPSTLMLLVNVLQDMQGATAGVRQLAAVLLRKKVFSLWQALPMESRAELKSILLTQLGVEPVRVVRFAVAHLVARIARADALQTGGVWPELQQAIRAAAEDPRVEMRELAMVLAYSIAEVVGECGSLSGLVADAVVRGMADTDVVVLRAALRAVAVLLPFVVERREVRELLLLRVVPQCRALLTQYAAVPGMCSLCVGVLDLLEQLIGELSVRRHEALLRDVAHDVLSVFANVANQARVRQNCSELLVTLVNEKPKFVTKVLLEPIITACMRVMGEDGTISLPEMAHVEEEEDEGDDGNHNHMNSNSNYDDDDDDDTEMLHVSPPCMYAGRLLSTLATNVSAKSFTGVLIPLVSQVVENPQAGPLERKATILSLACLAEGNPGYLRRRVQYVLKLTQDYLQDSNPVPREAAAFSLTYFCTHLQPEILEQHQQLFPMLVPLLHDDVDGVRRRVAGALDTLCENVAEDVEPYVQLVLPAVLDAIGRSSLQTQKELCGVISSLAMTRCPSFQAYASHCLELLKGPLMLRTPDTILLRAKVTEAAGIIANAIGKEAFLPYLPFFMERVVENLQTRQAELREESFGFLSNLCETLREDFMPYLDDSVNCALQTIYEDRTLYENKHLLAEGGIKSFNVKMDNGENNNNGEEEEEEEEEEEQEIHARVRTADVEEKSSAVYFIGVCAEVLLANFGVNRIDLCWSAMEQLDTHFHNNIRCNTLTTLAKLTKASHGSDTVIKSMTEDTLTPYARGMLNSLLNSTLLPCIYQETDKEVVASACDALEILFNFFGPQTIIEDMDAFVHTVATLLRQGTPCQKTLEDDDDEDDDEDEDGSGGVSANAGTPDGAVVLGEDHDGVLMDAVCDMLEAFAKAYGPSFRPSAEVLLPLLLPYTGEDRPAEDAVMATGSVAVVLAALGPAGGPFVAAAVQLAVRLLAAGDSAVRANAAFLLRTAADHDAWDPAGAAALLQALAPLLQNNESQESAAAVDNATSAACSILRRLPRGDSLLHTAVPVLLTHIPMRVDKAENENAIRTLVLLLTGEVEFITSQCGSEVLRCIAAVLASRTVEEEQKQLLVHQGVAPFLQQCRQQWNEACTQLPLELQNALRQYGCL